MPLTTDTYAVADALAEIDDQIDEIADTLDDLEPGTDRYEALVSRANTLEYQANGVVWMRDEGGWGEYEVEFGALSAGEKARMQRELPDEPADGEITLWFVAAGTVDGPYVGADLTETFATLASDVHDGYVQWAEARINDLSRPGNAEQRLQTSLQESEAEAT